MKIDQAHLTVAGGWLPVRDGGVGNAASLVLAFGTRKRLTPDLYASLRARYPEAHIALSSTAGNILDTSVSDTRVSVTAFHFEQTTLHTATATLNDTDDATVGRALASRLAAHATAAQPLVHMLLLSDGQHVNASQLVAGCNAVLPDGATLSGGLAGDGERFEKTLVGLDAPPEPKVVAAIGFYGTALRVRCSSAGGWSPFGPSRLVTRAEGSHLHELDGASALDLYRRYLGPLAAALPGAALRFPLESIEDGADPVVRTILQIDEKRDVMTFAGSIPEGARVRLMRASYEDLVNGAIDAAQGALIEPDAADFALCISCVGRRIVLGQRVEDETEGVRDLLGERVAMAGFYSYGELAPGLPGDPCALHNQTMTITLFAEA